MTDIKIRHSETHDVDAIRQIAAHPAVYMNTLQYPFPSLEKWRKRLENAHERGVSLVAEIDGAVVGHLGLQFEPNPRRRHAAGLGMMVSTRPVTGAASAAGCSRPRSISRKTG